MWKATSTLVSLVGCLMMATSQASAQAECNALLVHGVYDHFRESGLSSSASRTSSEICQAYSRLQQDSASGGASANYGLFGGSVSLSRDQLESIASQMCKSDFSDAAASASTSRSGVIINAAAVQAWRECTALHQDGLRASTTFREDDQGGATFAVRYSSPAARPIKVDSVVVSPNDSFTCRGSLWDAAQKGGTIGTQSLSMVCERSIATTPTRVGLRAVHAPAATISIITEAGTINRHFAAVLPPPPEASRGIGEVVSSVLSEAQFRKAYGPDWVVADGRAVPNTAFAREVAPSVPDLRGRFLLAADNMGGSAKRVTTDASASRVREAGGLEARQITINQLPSHAHWQAVKLWRGPVDRNGVFDINSPDGQQFYAPITRNGNAGNNWSWQGSNTGETGKGEAFSVIPPFLTVNMFIRVNCSTPECDRSAN